MSTATHSPPADTPTTSGGGGGGADLSLTSANVSSIAPNGTGAGLPPYSVNNVTGPWLTYTTEELPPLCAFSTSYSIVYSCLAVVFLLFGILLTFFGYRFFKVVMFLTGFVFSSVLVFMIMDQEAVILPEANLGVAAGAGLLLGLFTMLIQHAGLFLTGLNVGAALVMCVLVVVEQFIHPPSRWIPIGTLLGVGVLCGIFALRFQKGMTILGTSIVGAAIGVAGVDYFVEFSRTALYVWDRVLAKLSPGLCWYSWLMLGLWPLFALTGVLLQWRVTSVGKDHRVALITRKEQTENLHQNRARQKRDTQQTRYRHLYQARRVKGDVISQNFLHSIQDKLSPDMRSLTALNTEPNIDEESTATTTLTQIT